MREERSDGKQLPRSLDLDIVFMVLFFSIFRRNIFYHMFFLYNSAYRKLCFHSPEEGSNNTSETSLTINHQNKLGSS